MAAYLQRPRPMARSLNIRKNVPLHVALACRAVLPSARGCFNVPFPQHFITAVTCRRRVCDNWWCQCARWQLSPTRLPTSRCWRMMSEASSSWHTARTSIDRSTPSRLPRPGPPSATQTLQRLGGGVSGEARRVPTTAPSQTPRGNAAAGTCRAEGTEPRCVLCALRATVPRGATAETASGASRTMSVKPRRSHGATMPGYVLDLGFIPVAGRRTHSAPPPFLFSRPSKLCSSGSGRKAGAKLS